MASWVPWSWSRLSSIVQWGGAVLQQYSGVGLSAAVAGWGCFAVVRDLVNSFCPLSHSSELLYAADTGNDYNYRLEERRDGAVSMQGCLFSSIFVLLRHVMLLCPRDIN